MTNRIKPICKRFFLFLFYLLPVLSCFASENVKEPSVMFALSEEEILFAETATSRTWLKPKVQGMSQGQKKILYVLMEKEGAKKWNLSEAEIEEKIAPQHAKARDWFLKTSNNLFDIGQTFDMTTIIPHSLNWYKTGAIARDAGYNVGSYDFLIAIEASLPLGAAVGIGNGGKVATVRLGHAAALVHEIGHLIGLPHSNSFVKSIHPFDKTRKFEYGDSSCMMGSMGKWGQFHPYYKEALGWIPTSSVIPVLMSGEYVVYAHDELPIEDKILGLKVSGEEGENYILSFRKNFQYENYNQGVSIHSVPEQGFGSSYIIDANTPKQPKRSLDHALQSGDSLTNEAAGFTITAGDVINNGKAIRVSIRYSDFDPVVDSDGDGVNDADELRLERDPNDASDFGFEFSEAGELYGFSMNERLADIEANDAGHFTVTGGTNNTSYSSAKVRLRLNGSEFSAIQVRFAVDHPKIEANTSRTATPRLIWTTTSGLTKTVFAIETGHIDEVFATAVFPLESVAEWTNETIKTLDFWVDRTAGATTSIDWIRHIDPGEDSDGDGITNGTEGYDDNDRDSIPNFLDLDSDEDGIADAQEGEGDVDGDSIPDFLDPVNATDNDNQDNTNEDTGEAEDTVEDENTVEDEDTIESDFLDSDSDADGINDATEGDYDTDGDGTPNYLDVDSDADGILDAEEGIFDGDDDGIPSYTDDDDSGEGAQSVIEPIVIGSGCSLSTNKALFDPVLLVLVLWSLVGLRRKQPIK